MYGLMKEAICKNFLNLKKPSCVCDLMKGDPSGVLATKNNLQRAAHGDIILFF